MFCVTIPGSPGKGYVSEIRWEREGRMDKSKKKKSKVVIKVASH